MRPPHILGALVSILLALPVVTADRNGRYTGYLVNREPDPGSAVYRTVDTNTAPVHVLPGDPDVCHNAIVDEDSVRVDAANHVAKIIVNAKVLDLLDFNGGVHAVMHNLGLRIDDVYARYEWEARLDNVIRMVHEVLGDMNITVAAVGKNVTGAEGGQKPARRPDAEDNGSQDTFLEDAQQAPQHGGSADKYPWDDTWKDPRDERKARERRERLERERQEHMDLERRERELREKLERERLEREKLEQERLEREKRERERLEKEKGYPWDEGPGKRPQKERKGEPWDEGPGKRPRNKPKGEPWDEPPRRQDKKGRRGQDRGDPWDD